MCDSLYCYKIVNKLKIIFDFFVTKYYERVLTLCKPIVWAYESMQRSER